MFERTCSEAFIIVDRVAGSVEEVFAFVFVGMLRWTEHNVLEPELAM